MNEATRAAAPAAASRRPKLDSIDPDHVVLMARRALLFPSLTRFGRASVERLLKSAAERSNNEEARFLLRTLFIDPNPDRWVAESRSRMLAEVLRDDDSCWGRYYRGHALSLWSDRSEEGRGLLRRLADEGFAPALSALAEVVAEYDPAESQKRARKAADLGDPDGLALWASAVQPAPERSMLFARSAALGSAYGLKCLARVTVDNVQRTILLARRVLQSGRNSWDTVELRSSMHKLRVRQTWTRENVVILYVAGRELEG